MVTVTVENSGTAGAQVPVTVHMSRGEATEQLIVAGNAKASVRIVAVAVPEEINVNDGSVPESEGTSHTYKIEANH